MLLDINNYKSIFGFIKSIRIDIFRISIFTLAVGLLSQGKHLQHFAIPLGTVTIIATALSLLLTFRTGQAYDRWWEARMIWGAIVNDSRTFIRQLQLYLPKDQHATLKLFADRQIIWCQALTTTLRKLPDSASVQDYCTAHMITDSNKPNALLSLHAQQLKTCYENGLINTLHLQQLDDTLTRLCESMGKCERIKNTVFPASYGSLIHLLIYLFALILPFSLDDSFVWIKIILTAVIPIIFFIIEKTAILMQDPFENAPMDTPMTTISNTIAKNLYEMLQEPVIETPTKAANYYYVL